jgi:RNA polymerase-binding transcription factor DksA
MPPSLDHEAMVDLTHADEHPGLDNRATRSRLEAERQRLTRLIVGLEDEGLDRESEADSLGEITPVSQHPADVGSETFERERDFSLLEEFGAELREVERAIGRLADGSYGRCAACHASINPDRLAAVPATRYCKICQDCYERRGSLATESVYVAGGIVGDPAEFLPDDDDLELSVSGSADGPEEDAVAIYRDSTLSQAEHEDELAARGLFDKEPADRAHPARRSST